MPFLTHAGVSLRWDRAGSGPAVLLIHGWTCNRTYWERQVQGLRDRFTVVTVDLRGHGESSRPQRGYTPAIMAGDLEHLVRALGVPRIAVVGWSMGGMVAIELVRRLGERASALGLVGTSAGGLRDPANPLAHQPDTLPEMLAAIHEDFRSFVRGFAAGLFKAGAASPLFAWTVGQMQKTPPHVAAQCMEALAAWDGRTHLADLRVRTLVLHGRDDHLLPLANGEHLAAHVPGAELVVFEGSGHSPHLEEPEAFNQALVRLLGT